MAHGFATYRGFLVSLLVLPLVVAPGIAARPSPRGAATSAAPAATATSTSRAGATTATAAAISSPRASTTAPAATSAPPQPGATETVPPGGGSDNGSAGLSGDTGGGDSGLLEDELLLLGNTAPELSTSVPMSSVPPITGSVATLETRIIGLLSSVQSSSLSAGDKATLLNRLLNLSTSLAPALDIEDQIGTLRLQEQALLQSRVDTQAGIDKLSAQVQLNLNQLRTDVETSVSADVVASVGSLTVTVNGGADTIQARLGAQVNRLLVNVITDLDVLHIATLTAVANVDTARLNVNLFAQVKKLRLDLKLLLTALKVSVHSDVSAAIAAEASLTASLALEIDGLRASLAANVDAKLAGLDALLTQLVNTYNGDLASATSALQDIQSQIH